MDGDGEEGAVEWVFDGVEVSEGGVGACVGTRVRVVGGVWEGKGEGGVLYI